MAHFFDSHRQTSHKGLNDFTKKVFVTISEILILKLLFWDIEKYVPIFDKIPQCEVKTVKLIWCILHSVIPSLGKD